MSVAFDDIKNGDKIEFKLVTGSTLQSTYKDVICNGIVPYNVASMIDTEIVVKHTILYPYFKTTGDYSDPNNYEFIIIKDQLTGKTIPIGLPWINKETLLLTTNKTLSIKVSSFNLKQEKALREFFNNLGCVYDITELTK